MALREDGSLWLSNSEIEEFQRCKRQHWWGTVKRLEPNDPPNPLRASEIGTRFHTVMERYYAGASESELLAELQADAARIAEVTPGGDAHKAAELVLTMAEGYFLWAAETGADHGVGVIAPETTHTRVMPEFPDVIFAGRLDLETEEAIVDFKTTKLPFTTKSRTLQRSRQLPHYAWLLEPTRYVNRVRFRIAKQTTRSDRTSPPYYYEDELPVTRRRLRAHEDHLREIVPEIKANYARTTLPAPTPAEHCSWICPFYLVCDAADQGEDYQQLLADGFHEGDPDQRYKEDE